MYSPSVDVNLMQIVVQLHYIPPNLWAGTNVEQIRASIGEFVERVPELGMMLWILFVSESKLTSLRLSKQACTYDSVMAQRNGLHSPTNGCRYFVIYAQMEKHCPTHYSEDFIDPGSNLP